MLYLFFFFFFFSRHSYPPLLPRRRKVFLRRPKKSEILLTIIEAISTHPHRTSLHPTPFMNEYLPRPPGTKPRNGRRRANGSRKNLSPPFAFRDIVEVDSQKGISREDGLSSSFEPHSERAKAPLSRYCSHGQLGNWTHQRWTLKLSSLLLFFFAGEIVSLFARLTLFCLEACAPLRIENESIKAWGEKTAEAHTGLVTC